MPAQSLQRLKKLLSEQVPGLSVSTREDTEYKSLTALWNTKMDYRPLAVVQPTTNQEVAAVVQATKAVGIPHIAIRGGGHSFEALSLGGGQDDKVLVIDIIRMNKVTSDPAKDILTAQGGALLGHVSLHAWEHGQKMLPMGTCPGVGIGGQSQCGGYGFYTRTYGTLTDRVLSFEVVTADGVITTASEQENPDLFFALRGSGMGSFGVITSVTLRTNDAPRATASFSLRWNLADHNVGMILKSLQTACINSPLTVNPMVIAWLGVVEVSGCLLTDSDNERDQVWADFKGRLPEPDTVMFEPMNIIDTVIQIEKTQTSAPWYDHIDHIKREGDEYSRYMKIKAGFIPQQLSDEFLTQLGDFLKTQPASGVRVQLLGLNPHSTPDPDTTSIKARGCPWLMGMSIYLQTKDYGIGNVEKEANARHPWLTQAYELFYPLTSGGYLGDDDYDEGLHGRDMFQSYYGHHLPRLIAVKKRHDPNNLFHHPLSVPVSLDK